MTDWPRLQCWCEEEIPPWSVAWIKEVMNPTALEPPIAVVARPTSNLEFAEEAAIGLLAKTWDPYYLYYTTGLYVANLRPEAVTNGPITVPGKTLFQAKQLMFGAHWLRYDEVGANPEHDWFYPRTDTWRLASVVDASLLGGDPFTIRGCVFRRIGRADTIQKCVPVVMLSQDDG